MRCVPLLSLLADSIRFASQEASRPAFVRATRTHRLAGATNSVSHRIASSRAQHYSIILLSGGLPLPLKQSHNRAEQNVLRVGTLVFDNRHYQRSCCISHLRPLVAGRARHRQSARTNNKRSRTGARECKERLGRALSIAGFSFNSPIARTRVPLERASRAHPLLRIERPLPPIASVSVFVLCASSNSLPKAISPSYSIAESSVRVFL